LVTPPDRVWQAIRTELGFTSHAGEPPTSPGPTGTATVTALPRSTGAETNGAAGPPATVTPISDAPKRSSRGRRGLALLVAAAVALVLGVGLGLGLDRILGPRQTVLWTAELQALPAFPGSTGEASVVEDKDGNRTLVIELESPEPVDGSRQVWLIDTGVTKMRSLGYLTGVSGRLPIPGDLDPHEFPVVDVSKEPPADTDVRHSGNSIVRGNLNV
jgi:anti-sigma-K factor RskA